MRFGCTRFGCENDALLSPLIGFSISVTHVSQFLTRGEELNTGRWVIDIKLYMNGYVAISSQYLIHICHGGKGVFKKLHKVSIDSSFNRDHDGPVLLVK